MSHPQGGRKERELERLAHSIVEGGGRGAPDARSEEAAIMRYLAAGGPALPAGERAEAMRAELVSRARQAEHDSSVGRAAPVTVARPGGLAPVLAKAAVAVLVATVVLAGLGAGSTNAMPGDPFYSIKRLIEGAHLALLPGGQAEADALLNYADERMDELEYTGAREMDEWYSPLAKGAQSRIDSAYRDSAVLDEVRRARVRSRVRRAEERLQSLIGRALPHASGQGREDLERVMERARRRLGSPGVEQPGPGGQENPGSTGGQEQMQQQQQQQQQQNGQAPPEGTDPGGQTQQQQQQDSGQQGNQYDGMSIEQMLFSPQKNQGGARLQEPAGAPGKSGELLQAPAHDAGD